MLARVMASPQDDARANLVIRFSIWLLCLDVFIFLRRPHLDSHLGIGILSFSYRFTSCCGGSFPSLHCGMRVSVLAASAVNIVVRCPNVRDRKDVLR